MGEDNKGVNLSPVVQEKLYDDLIHPVAEPIGKLASFVPRTVVTVLQPFEKWLINREESMRLTMEALTNKVDKIPEERLCDPEPYVAIPAIQQISYCYDSKELRNLYANLLASSMDKNKKKEVHPGYVDIIKQLTPDEAKLLKRLPRDPKGLIPIISLGINKGPTNGKIRILRHYTILGIGLCEYPESICSYLDNLNRLELIHISEDQHIVDNKCYEPLENSQRIMELKSQYVLKDGQSFVTDKELFYVTSFGLDFIRCCVDG